jgi:hypothetical protein
VIRNACIHVANEQPLLADLFDVPTAADAGLLCTNLRMMDGKRPVFIDAIDATFFFPYHVIRFIEIPAGALEAHVPRPATGPKVHRTAGPDSGRGNGRGHGGADGRAVSEVAEPSDTRLPVPAQEFPEPEADGDTDLEIDEGFLRRIRDI